MLFSFYLVLILKSIVVFTDIVADGKLMFAKDKSYKLEGDYNRSFHLRIDPVRPRHAGDYGCQIYLDGVIQHSVELVVNGE